MGLIKFKQVNSVLSGEYWNIAHLLYDSKSELMQVRLSLFVSRDSKEAGDNALLNERILINDFNRDSDMSYTAIYSKIKELPEFLDAEDLLENEGDSLSN